MTPVTPVQSLTSIRTTTAIIVALLLGSGLGFAIGNSHHSSGAPAASPSDVGTTPDLSAMHIRAASHGELVPVRILPIPHGADIPTGVLPVQVRDGNKPALIWVVTRDGKTVFFPGSAFDTKGDNLAIPLMRTVLSSAATPPPIPATGGSATQPSNALLNAVSQAQGFIWAASAVGTTAAPNVVLFADPNCIFCHKEFDQLKPLVDAGKLVVKVVPIAFLKASSMGKAEALLQGGVPAFLKNEEGFNDGTEEGAITPVKTTESPALSGQVQSNTHLMSNLEGGRMATPFILIRQGASWTPHLGLMAGTDVSALLNQG